MYYKLCYGTLPQYFNHYREIIERQPARPLRQHLIHPSFVRTVYAECTPLYQLIKLINSLKTDKSDTILEKIVAPNCSYSEFSYHVVNSYLTLTLTLTLKRVYFDNNEYCNLRKKNNF